jgi:hypothetical protein
MLSYLANEVVVTVYLYEGFFLPLNVEHDAYI